ncbi:serine/threonine protein kinase [Natribacillus halophilus]|uniref:Serine/threonine protein kinase n=1 Tax=Natribacillus halophilus TaxID=549003 RepID=A0A1G8RJQ0_9BACI|nr:protein kinase family protein [Natribacillus halophilus]SDJ16600.1 serine/threonine protein kinase [Natribacillus halophilus]
MEKKNHTLKNEAPDLPNGTRLLGKWYRKPYHIRGILGRGATGVVYLAEAREGEVALKVGNNSMSITSEVNVLKHFAKVQGHILGPSFIDADDVYINGRKYPFYVMEYLQGETLFNHIDRHGKEWGPVLIVQLLGDLDRLHRAGWVFGDLKPDNLIVVGGPPYRVRWLDVGGTTVLGRSVKEYTEFFDRGYWGLGDRKAEPTYDLFAAAMILLNMTYKKRFEKGRDGKETLIAHIEGSRVLSPYQQWLKKALFGQFADAEKMRQALMHIISKEAKPLSKDPSSQAQQKSANHQKKKRKKQKGGGRRQGFSSVDVVLVISFLLLASALYWVGQVI